MAPITNPEDLRIGHWYAPLHEDVDLTQISSEALLAEARCQMKDGGSPVAWDTREEAIQAMREFKEHSHK